MAAIYGLIDPITQELKYIGQTIKSPEVRLEGHLRDARYAKYGTKNIRWIKSLQEKGINPVLVVLESNLDINQLNELEIFYIAYFKFIGCTLNNMTPGGLGHLNHAPSLETRKKLSDSHKKKKCIDLETGKIYPSMMSVHREFNFHQGHLSYCLAGKTASIHGKYFSYLPKNVEDLSKWKADELLKRQSITLKANNKSYLHKKIQCIETGEIFDSLKGASKKLKVKSSSICMVLKGSRSRVGGFTFKYVRN